MTDCLLVMTALPDMESARNIAHRLLDQKLAACISVMPAMTSIYVWNGEVCESGEYLLLIKTSVPRYSTLESFLREQHPYELPEIIATEITHGLPDYLGWINESTQE